MPNVIINDIKVEVPENVTVLEAIRLSGGYVPTLCHMKLDDIKIENNPASCRICMVEVAGRRNLAPACVTPIAEGMVIKTHSKSTIP